MSIGLLLFVIWLVGFMPFGLYWMVKFGDDGWGDDAYIAVAVGVAWPLLLIPCLLIHLRRAVTGDRDREQGNAIRDA